jgi:hypothetical protein
MRNPAQLHIVIIIRDKLGYLREAVGVDLPVAIRNDLS